MNIYKLMDLIIELLGDVTEILVILFGIILCFYTVTWYVSYVLWNISFWCLGWLPPKEEISQQTRETKLEQSFSESWLTRLANKLKEIPSWKIHVSMWWIERMRDINDTHIRIENSEPGKSLHSLIRQEGLVVHLLPDVKSFKIKLRSFDFVMKLFGINVKHRPQITIEKLGLSNRRMNRYVVWQFRRIANHPKGWEIGRILIRRSLSYRFLALKHVFPNWHKSLTIHGALHLLKQVEALCKGEQSKLEFSRAYVDKSDGSARPLGVPTPAWRIYLHMWQNVLTQRIRPELSIHQHGFLPGRGVLTAWKDIFENVIDSSNIYEYDLKGFFDGVRLKAIEQFLLDIGMPYDMVNWVHKLNRSPLNYESVKKIRGNEWPFLQEQWNKADSLSDGELVDMLLESVREHPGTIYDKMEQMWLEADELLGQSEAMEASIGMTPEDHRKGVPQGAPTSPILAICALDPLLCQIPHVQYADDGLGYSNESAAQAVPQSIPALRESGIELHEKKSGFVKFEGTWLKPLKFLGMEYDGVSDTFRAKTRGGATLELDGARKDLLKFEKWLGQNLSELKFGGSAAGLIHKKSLEENLRDNQRTSWKNLLTSRWTGLLFSRMQMDSWNVQMHQDFSLEGGTKRNSWLGSVLRKRQYIAPSWSSVLGLENENWAWVKLRGIGKVRLTLFNASSFAIHDLAERYSRKYKKG